jgi:hypothetical protein
MQATVMNMSLERSRPRLFRRVMFFSPRPARAAIGEERGHPTLVGEWMSCAWVVYVELVYSYHIPFIWQTRATNTYSTSIPRRSPPLEKSRSVAPHGAPGGQISKGDDSFVLVWVST